MPVLLGWLGKIAVTYVGDKLLVFLRSIIEVWIARYEMKERAQAAVDKLKAAKTPAEASDAKKDTLDNL